ncbi:hypothetical protein GCM10023156_32410 [Novipirellula rosea]|uniref:Uncharacterized protein n=1 Tax=Novipirellula rosea TaxID=1031540 RepID=A0ABP8MXY7_9BACT
MTGTVTIANPGRMTLRHLAVKNRKTATSMSRNCDGIAAQWTTANGDQLQAKTWVIKT